MAGCVVSLWCGALLALHLASAAQAKPGAEARREVAHRSTCRGGLFATCEKIGDPLKGKPSLRGVEPFSRKGGKKTPLSDLNLSRPELPFSHFMGDQFSG